MMSKRHCPIDRCGVSLFLSLGPCILSRSAWILSRFLGAGRRYRLDFLFVMYSHSLWMWLFHGRFTYGRAYMDCIVESMIVGSCRFCRNVFQSGMPLALFFIRCDSCFMLHQFTRRYAWDWLLWGMWAYSSWLYWDRSFEFTICFSISMNFRVIVHTRWREIRLRFRGRFLSHPWYWIYYVRL